MSSATRSRRAFLKASAAAGGGLLLGFSMPFAVAAAGEVGEAEVFAPDAFIRIDRSGKITLIMPQAEMGQGVYTAVAMILAEELDAAFDQVTLQAAPPSDKLYANPIFGIQVTGNSNSIRVLLDVAAQGRRGRARAPGAGGGAGVDGRSRDVPHRQERGAPRRERPTSRLCRARRRGRGHDAAADPPVKRAGGLSPSSASR